MDCAHAEALVLITRRNYNGEPQVSWCPACGAVRVLNANLSRWILPEVVSQEPLSAAVRFDLICQKQSAP